jgi:hypothetical protein
MDAIRTSHGSIDVTQQAYGASGKLNPPCAGDPGPGGSIDYSRCSGNQSIPNHFPDGLTRFEYPIPPEIRWAVRVHWPRRGVASAAERPVRDPLHDDVLDVELDESVTLSSAADTVVVRFRDANGKGTLFTNPTGVPVPPNADRANGYRDSFGVRLGGQWNALRDVLAIRAGAWCESRSQDPRFLTISPVGGTRFGFGGGVVVRTHALDVSVGYQRQFVQTLDNHGDGVLRAPAGVRVGEPFDLSREPPGVTAADRTQYRTEHTVNGGKVSFDAHVFTLGGVIRF